MKAKDGVRKLIFGFVASLLLMPSQSISAKLSEKTGSKFFTAKDIIKLESVRDAQISPDGHLVVFSQQAGDLMKDRDIVTLWIVSADGGGLQQLVKGEASHPRWSPDSDRVAFLAHEADGNSQIQVLSISTGMSMEITHTDQSPEDIAWSPDGRSIAFTAFVPGSSEVLGSPLKKPPGATWAPPLRFTTAKHIVSDSSGYVRPGRTHLFVVPSIGGAVRQLTFGSTDEATPTWSPDGVDLVYSARDESSKLLDFNLDRIQQVNVVTAKVTRLSPDPIDASVPVVSPDGRHIAFIGWVSPHPGDFFPIDVYVMDRDGSHAHPLDPSLDRVAASPRWTSDGRSILFRYADRGVDKVARAGLDGSFAELAQGVVDGFSVSKGGVLAFPLGGADHPADLGTAEDGRTHRLTRLNDPLLRGLRPATLRPLPVYSSFDGAEVGAWVLLPPGYDSGRRYPTILEIHGGPYGEDSPYWRTDSQVFAGAGYVVLYANYRGSTSYGLKFSTAIDRNFPSAAPYDDLMSAVDAAIAVGIADPSGLYVTGGSAGGELTAWIVGNTHRFKAAVAVKPIIDEISEGLENDQYLYDTTSEFGTTPWANPMLFWAHSPISLVENVSTPTLLIVGDKDRRTPLGQSLDFYNALHIRGIPAGLVIVPDASHESLKSRPSQRAEEDLATLAWFARYPGSDAAKRH